MEFIDVVRRRRTTNGAFAATPVSLKHQHLLVEAASRAPSHFNSQPWRFILIDDKKTREAVSKIAGRTMTQLMKGGRFFQRYRKYFRFDAQEMEERRDGILIDQLPKPLRRFTQDVMSGKAMRLMNMLGVPGLLGRDNAKLVKNSPLLLAVMLDKEEYRPGELSGFYSLLSLGMAIENVWLTCTDLGMGIQFVSTPMEIPGAWEELTKLFHVPDHLELMAVYRIGYVPKKDARPRIDWQSHQRKRIPQYVFRNNCLTPEEEPHADR
ncbi:MAG: nitroreductase family protein [Spirochaetia bacterium]|nr:nitroreductase family protein [Spirochaetia bacterium]